MNKVKTYLNADLLEFQKTFDEAVRSKIPLLDKIMRYIVKSKGKQLRPIFVLLSAKMNGEPTRSSYLAASFIELLHTATLVHDDVVDQAYTRRGLFTINALWKNKIAVLVGDYLLSKGLLLALDHDEFEMLKIISQAVKRMSEGELLQMEKARRLDIREDIYFDIIKGKTASLIAAACAAGAYSVHSDGEKAREYHELGELIGMAFQIKDDLFDYGKQDIGKPTGNDIKEKKMTLPLIYALQQSDAATRRKVKYIFKNKNKDKKSIQYVLDLVTKTGGIDYAERKMQEFAQKALIKLNSFEDSEPKKYFIDLVHYSINRKY